MRFQIGDVPVTAVVEMVDRSFDFLTFFPLANEEDLQANLDWMTPHHFDPGGRRVLLSMHSWLLEVNGKRILIDGCVGNGKQRDARPDWCNLSTGFLYRLAAAGARPEQIDYVLCTHLHADHVGWNTRLIDGRWVPTFSNATYVFSRREHEFWQAQLRAGRSGPHLQSYHDSVLPVVEAGQALIVDDGHEVEGQLLLEPAPGHTPGHVAIRLKSRDESGAFTGGYPASPRPGAQSALELHGLSRPGAGGYDPAQSPRPMRGDRCHLVPGPLHVAPRRQDHPQSRSLRIPAPMRRGRRPGAMKQPD